MYHLIKNKPLFLIMPILITLICLSLFVYSIIGYENHKQTGDDLYISLVPADPRSLLQGDYMTLNYELNIINPKVSNNDEFDSAWEYNNDYLKDKINIPLWIKTDNNQILTESYFEKTDGTIPLIVKNKANFISGLYPSVNSYFFAEGLGECYENAKFAHFKVDKNGKPLLIGLLGENLMALNCEK